MQPKHWTEENIRETDTKKKVFTWINFILSVLTIKKERENILQVAPYHPNRSREIGDLCRNFICRNFFLLAMVTKTDAAWSAVIIGVEWQLREATYFVWFNFDTFQACTRRTEQRIWTEQNGNDKQSWIRHVWDNIWCWWGNWDVHKWETGEYVQKFFLIACSLTCAHPYYICICCLIQNVTGEYTIVAASVKFWFK